MNETDRAALYNRGDVIRQRLRPCQVSFDRTSLVLDPQQMVIAPIHCGALGYTVERFVLRPQLIGTKCFAQFFWPDACVPHGFAASNGLRIEVLPP